MSITSKLKPLLDQPVWEWTRFNVTPLQTSGMTAPAGSTEGRYMYNLNGTAFTRFDSFTDTLQSLNTPQVAPVGLVDLTYKSYDGYYSRAISGTTTTINGSFINGKICKGKKIRIYEGTNDGEERTITDVSAPITVDYVVATAVSTTTPVSITDSSKTWQINQWRGYQYRIISGSAKGTIKRIIYNSANTLFFADVNFLGIEPRLSLEPFKSAPSSANDSTKSVGVIEYQTVTVDTPFTSNIDDSTRYIVLGGGIWMVSASTSAPFYTFQYYDVLSDSWSLKSAYSTFYLAQMGGTATPPNTISLERVGEYAGSYMSGVVTSSTLRTITDTSLNLTPNRYANYQVRFNNGQVRVIKEHTSDTITFYRDMEFAPTVGTAFNIYADNDKIFMSGAGANMLAQYSIQRDAWTQGEIHDSGLVRNIIIKKGSEQALPVSTLTFTTSSGAYGDASSAGFVTGVTVSNHWYKIGDTISIGGVTSAGDSIYNSTSAIIRATPAVNSFVYTISATPADTTITTGNTISPTTALLPDIQKNWIDDEHRGKVAFVSNNSTPATTNARLIYGNSSNVLSSFAFAGAHTIGTRYHIQDLKSFGADSGIGSNSSIITGTLTNGSPRITAPTSLSSFKLNTPILALTGVPVNARIVGIDAPNNELIMSANANATTTLSISGDQRFTNGWGICNGSIVSFRNGDITIPLSLLTHATGTATATTTVPHGYTTGDRVCIRGVSLTDPNYMVTYSPITVTSPTTFTYSMATTTNSPATALASNSTSQLVDSGKNWPINLFAGARGRIIAGTGAGQEFTINSNTNSIIVFLTALATAPDSSSVYVIYPNQARGIGHILRYIGNNSDPDTKGKYMISVRGGNTSNIEKFNITRSEWEFVDAQPLSFVSDTLGPGTVGAYDGEDRLYLQKNNTHRFVYLDVNTDEIIPWGQAPNPSTPATILAGNKCEVVSSEDGIKYLYFQKNDSAEMYRALLFV
jgi:hypothetical protein